MTTTLPTTKSGIGPSDAALVVAARAQESWACEALFTRHAARALGLAQRMLGRADEADDLLQDAFVNAFARLDKLDNPQAFSAWLSMIIVRLAQKRLRRNRMLVRLGLRSADAIEPDTLVHPSAPPEAASELLAIYSVIASMPAEERIALVLRRIEGMSLAEIALHMRLSLATVKRRLASAEVRLKQFRARLE